MRDRLAERGFSGRVPVFPLPNVVFFPGVALPLHVFEPRYRKLLEDAVAGEKLIALATLLPGWEKDYEGAPAFHPLATIGQVENVERLPDGRSNIMLVGLERAQLEEEFTDLPYRLAAARVVPDRAVASEEDPELLDLKLRLLVTFAYCSQIGREADVPLAYPSVETPFETVVHTICQTMDVPVVQRLRALEMAGPLERAPLARGWLAARLDAVLVERGLPRLSLLEAERN
ncbi:MAG: LON peptidase substrate-binding domain-containing protein [Candidatus Eiseniibacteriota bacterium]